MNIDLTFLGQIVVFVAMVTLMWKLLYGPLNSAMEARTKKIADGLAAAEAGKEAKALAEAEVAEQLKQARAKAQEIIASAEKRAAEVQEESANKARAEAQNIITAAREEIEAEVVRARQGLRSEVASVAMLAAERILDVELDDKRHAKLIEDAVAQGFGRA